MHRVWTFLSKISKPRYHWAGREFDVDTTLQYHRARCFDSSIGRWLSSDALACDADDADLHRYPYPGGQ